MRSFMRASRAQVQGATRKRVQNQRSEPEMEDTRVQSHSHMPAQSCIIMHHGGRRRPPGGKFLLSANAMQRCTRATIPCGLQCLPQTKHLPLACTSQFVAIGKASYLSELGHVSTHGTLRGPCSHKACNSHRGLAITNTS